MGGSEPPSASAVMRALLSNGVHFEPEQWFWSSLSLVGLHA